MEKTSLIDSLKAFISSYKSVSSENTVLDTDNPFSDPEKNKEWKDAKNFLDNLERNRDVDKTEHKSTRRKKADSKISTKVPEPDTKIGNDKERD